jgi:hypothetical protein
MRMTLIKLTLEQLAIKCRDTGAAETALQTHSLDKIYEIVTIFDKFNMLEKNGKTVKRIAFEIYQYITENIYS